MRFDFLLCSERSGSNLIAKIMNAHPEVCGPSPKNVIETFSRGLYRYGDISQDSNWNCLCSDIADLLNNGHGLWKSHFTASEIKQAVKTRSVSEIYRYAYEREAAANRKSRLFIKNNHVYRYATHLVSYFQDARFLYMVRDPRDMALEWENSPLLPGGLVNATRTWKEDQHEGMIFYAQLRELNKIHLIRFEDLLQNSEQVLQGVCAFLGLDYTAQMLDFYKAEDVIANAERVGAWRDLAQPLMKSNFNFYRNGLGENAIKYIEATCSEEMDFFGYKKDFADPGDLTALSAEMNLRPVPPIVRTESEKEIYAALFAAVDQVNKRRLY